MAIRFTDPSLFFRGTPTASPGVVATQDDAEALKAAYDAQYPFMPSGSFTAPTVLPPMPTPRDFGRTQALASALSGSAQPDDVSANAGRSDIEAGGGGWGVPRRRSMAGTAQLAAALPAPATATVDAPGGTMGSLLQAADNLRAAKIAGEQRDVMNQLSSAGAIPSEGDSPEARLVKQNYLGSRLGQELAYAGGLTSQAPRAPGTPVYLGTRKPGDNSIVPGAGPDIPREIGTPLPSNSQWAYLTDLAAKAAQEERVRLANPRLVTAGLDASGRPVQAMVDRNGNSKLVDQPKPIMQQVQVGGKTLFVGPGDRYFDEQGRPVDMNTSVPKAPDVTLMNMDPELYDAMRQEYLNWQAARGGKPAPAPGAPPAKPAKVPASGTSAPVPIATQADLDALKPGTRFSYNGKIGVKK